jgi:hypothetical protein
MPKADNKSILPSTFIHQKSISLAVRAQCRTLMWRELYACCEAKAQSR